MAKCIICNNKNAYYNYEGLKPEYCSECKEIDMIDVKNKKCISCHIDRANYNYIGLKPKYCFNCKKENMLNVVEKRICISCNITRGLYDGYCSPCYHYLFPESNITKNYKIKQNIITEELKKHFNFDSFDKIINNSCCKYRPDIFKDCFTHSIIIEIDENKHSGYDEICENKRIMTLFQGLANRPLVVIRFNPDKCSNSESIFTKKLKLRKTIFINRINELIKIINYHLYNIPQKDLTIEKLFYE